MLATSSALAGRRMMELGRWAVTKAAATSSSDRPVDAISFFSISATPSDRVGPGRMELTVTPVPAARFARPREMASMAVLVMP